METDDASVILPTLDEHDVAAIEAILVRTIRAQDQTNRDREEIKAANARIVDNAQIRDSAYQALRVFGFDGGPEGVNLWTLVRKAIGNAKYDRAIAVARGAQFPALLTQMGDDRPPTEAVVRVGVALGDSAEATVIKRSVPIRTAILGYLEALGERGAKVGQVKKHLAEAYGITVHEKTPGMTLYRLLKDGLVRREGRTWYAKNEESEESEVRSGQTATASYDFDDLIGEPQSKKEEAHDE